MATSYSVSVDDISQGNSSSSSVGSREDKAIGSGGKRRRLQQRPVKANIQTKGCKTEKLNERIPTLDGTLQ